MTTGRLREISPAAVVAVLASLAGTIAGFAGALLHRAGESGERDWVAMFRYVVFDQGATLVAGWFLVVAVLDVAARCSGAARAQLHAAAALLGAVAGWRLMSYPLVDALVSDPHRVSELLRAGHQVAGAVMLAATILIVLAGGVIRRAPIAASVALAGMVLSGWMPLLGPKLGELVHEIDPRAGTIVFGLLELAWLAGVGLVLHALTAERPAAEDRELGARGLRRSERGLLIRAAAPLLLFAAGMISVRAPGGLKYLLLAGVATTLASWFLLGAGITAVMRSRVEGFAPGRVAVAGSLVIWWGAVSVLRALAIYRQLGGRDHSYMDGMEQLWSIGGPLIGAAGIALFGASIGAFARVRGNEDLRESALARTVTVVIIDVAVMLITTQLYKIETRDTAILVAIGLLIATIIGSLSFAQLLGRTAQVVESGPALPSARVL